MKLKILKAKQDVDECGRAFSCVETEAGAVMYADEEPDGLWTGKPIISLVNKTIDGITWAYFVVENGHGYRINTASVDFGVY